MTEHAYDIRYLLDAEPARTTAPVARAIPLPSPSPALPSLVDVQERMACELLQASTFHEALIQQYLRMHGDVSEDFR